MVDNVCQNALLPLIVGVPAPFLLELALTLALLLTTRWRPLPERLKALKALKTLKALKALKAWSCILLIFELHHSTYSITKSIYFIWLPAIPCFSMLFQYVYIYIYIHMWNGVDWSRTEHEENKYISCFQQNYAASCLVSIELLGQDSCPVQFNCRRFQLFCCLDHHAGSCSAPEGSRQVGFSSQKGVGIKAWIGVDSWSMFYYHILPPFQE